MSQAKRKVIALVDSYTGDSGLPTYSELVEALADAYTLIPGTGLSPESFNREFGKRSARKLKKVRDLMVRAA